MDISLYIHIPYCVKKCPYCDFNSYPINNGINKNFLGALKEEIHLKSIERNQCRIRSIFFGGGTPTVLPSNAIVDLLELCFNKFCIEPDCEISIEANPGTINFPYLKKLKGNGFNRLSLGCQSFNDVILKKIGRVHKYQEIYSSIKAAKEAGFDNFSLDLMFGLPGQSSDIWEDTLNKAVKLNPSHFSIYNMTVEQNTPFYDQLQTGTLALPFEEAHLEMYETAIGYLTSNDYCHYEISNFAKKGYECRHNKVYWNNCEYLGFGPGAASYINGTRSMNILSPEKYIHSLLDKKELPVMEKETLNQSRKIGETLMLGLRMVGGISVDDLNKRFGKSFDIEYGGRIKKLFNEKLLEYDDDRLKLTYKGILFSNEVFAGLV